MSRYGDCHDLAMMESFSITPARADQKERCAITNQAMDDVFDDIG